MSDKGIIAGMGELPVIISEMIVQREGFTRSFTVHSKPSHRLEYGQSVSDEIIRMGQSGQIWRAYRHPEEAPNSKEAIMAGKGSPNPFFSSQRLNAWTLGPLSCFFRSRIKSDDAIPPMRFTKELAGEGIEIIDTTKFSPHLLTPVGWPHQKEA